MKATAKTIFVILLTLQFTGCDGSDKLTTDSKLGNVKLVVKLPDEIDLLPAGIMYRSDLCPNITLSSRGEKLTAPGFHYVKSEFLKSADDTYLLPINIDGGGKCKWKLSNATIDVKYKLSSFGNGVERSIGSGVIIVFDDNLPQRYDGKINALPSDFLIKKDYYPWVNEKFLNGHLKQIWLYGDNLYSTYKYSNPKDKSIIFEPISHTDLIIYSTGPKVKIEGGDNYTVFKYPDGTIDYKGKDFPDFDKLQSLSRKEN